MAASRLRPQARYDPDRTAPSDDGAGDAVADRGLGRAGGRLGGGRPARLLEDARFGVTSDYGSDARGHDTPEGAIEAVIGRYVLEGDGTHIDGRTGIVVRDGHEVVRLTARELPAGGWGITQEEGCDGAESEDMAADAVEVPPDAPQFTSPERAAMAAAAQEAAEIRRQDQAERG